MKFQYSVIITILTLLIFLVTLSLYIDFKAAERATSDSPSPTVSIGQ